MNKSLGASGGLVVVGKGKIPAPAKNLTQYFRSFARHLTDWAIPALVTS
jgi:hypothetical protein